jgi:AcrR family transcriptional regulator
MARTREFNPEEALEEAMYVFWQKGYADTSVDDLVKATGVSRYGLYGHFGNKRGVFQAVLRSYQANNITSIFGPVEAEDASLGAIYQYFDYLIAASKTSESRVGCLMCNSITEEAAWDPISMQYIKEFQQRIRDGFARALRCAQRQGEVAAKADADEMANYLLGVVVGVSVIVRQPIDGDAVENFIRSALKRLS